MKMKGVNLTLPKYKLVIGSFLITLILMASFAIRPVVAEEQPQSTETSFQNVTVDIAYDMITNGALPELVVLDVRYQCEYDIGHLDNAVLIPYDELETRIGELEEHKNHEIIVYCRSGYRSQIACETLAEYNFTKVYNMLGGILAWIDADYPIYTTSHHVTVNIVDEEILLQIEPLLLRQTGCIPCAQNQTCPSDNERTEIQVTVLEQEADHIVILLVYEFNGTTLEVTLTTTRLWSHAEFTDEYNRTTTFTETEIAVENESVQFYSLSYMVQREEYVLTLYTRLKPLNPETFETAFTEMNYAPIEESGVVSMEFVEFNSSVTLSQQYAILGKVAKEIGKVYEKSGNETLAQLAQSYYTMEEEARYLSKLVEKQLHQYDMEILESSAVLMDHPVTCVWIFCIDWCDVLVGVAEAIAGPTCISLCCIAVPPLCPWCFIICEIILKLSGHALYLWCVDYFNCVIQWLTI